MVQIWNHLCIFIIKKDISILGKDPQGLDETALTLEVEYFINFNEQGHKFSLVWIIMGRIVRYLLMVLKSIYYSSIMFQHYFKKFSVDDLKSTGLYGSHA